MSPAIFNRFNVPPPPLAETSASPFFLLSSPLLRYLALVTSRGNSRRREVRFLPRVAAGVVTALAEITAVFGDSVRVQLRPQTFRGGRGGGTEEGERKCNNVAGLSSVLSSRGDHLYGSRRRNDSSSPRDRRSRFRTRIRADDGVAR